MRPRFLELRSPRLDAPPSPRTDLAVVVLRVLVSSKKRGSSLEELPAARDLPRYAAPRGGADRRLSLAVSLSAPQMAVPASPRPKATPFPARTTSAKEAPENTKTK